MNKLNLVNIDANTVAERAGLFGLGRVDVVAHAENNKFYLLEEIGLDGGHKAYGPLQHFNMDLHSAQLNWLVGGLVQVKGKTYIIANDNEWTVIEVLDEVNVENPPIYMEFGSNKEVISFLAELAEDANADNRRAIENLANTYFV